MPTTKKKLAKPQPAPAFKSYALRTCNADLTSHNGFQWPAGGRVEAPDWNPRPGCGNGLHGLLMGKGDATLCNWEPDAKWLVVGIDEWVDLSGKVKFPAATVIYAGDLHGAAKMLQELGAGTDIVGGTATAGVGGTATAGYGGCLAIRYWDSKNERWRVRIAEVGEDGIEANTAYQLRGDKFVRVSTPSKEVM